MKKLKLNIAMIAMVLGVSAAFAFKPAEAKVTKANFTWYAVKTGTGTFSWQSTQPAGSCVAATGTCEISTTIAGTPPANGYPASYSVLQGSDKHSAYSN